MPIDYKLYGPEWPAISRRIRQERAGSKCERCGVPNKAEGYWVVVVEAQAEAYYPEGLSTRTDTYKDGSTKTWRFYTEEQIMDTLDYTGFDLLQDVDPDKRASRVVLTVAHLNHDVGDHSEANLEALCQWCHLSHDRKDNHRRRKYGKTGKYRDQLVLGL